MISAIEMHSDQSYIIHSIIDSPLQVNFLEIGVLVGKRIKLLHQAPFSGSMAFEVGENLVFMRKSEANLIQVIPEGENQDNKESVLKTI
ncbi:FeoA domain-containing protein [Aquiflexum balticum DSM 16537]|uniref:FeoA domain-containing protein n=1 Tax=Aquiflexum balticum DSM 16537 TaxID=758820 RepID=A0A1W2GZY7_9BACT|nr:FeoA family protein [Aquiflexum balticum]SMD42219.1 FeoA domain-containing protein [Aquiflexum balticum DSM 16537]